MTAQIKVTTKYAASWREIAETGPERYELTLDRNGKVQKMTLDLEDVTTVAFLMNHLLFNELGLEYQVRYPGEATVQTAESRKGAVDAQDHKST